MHKAITSNHTSISAVTQQISYLGEPRSPIATGGPVLEIDLVAELLQLQLEPRWSGDRNAVTLVKHRDFRMVLEVMKAGTKLARHKVRGTVLIQVFSGHIQVEILDATVDATAGQMVSLDANLAHEVKAVEDSALLITIAWPENTCVPRPESDVRPIRAVDASYDWQKDESVWN